MFAISVFSYFERFQYFNNSGVRNSVANFIFFSLPDNQAGLFQDAQMLGNIGLREGETFLDLANAAFAFHQIFHQFQSGRMSQCPANAGNFLVSLRLIFHDPPHINSPFQTEKQPEQHAVQYARPRFARDNTGPCFAAYEPVQQIACKSAHKDSNDDFHFFLLNKQFGIFDNYYILNSRYVKQKIAKNPFLCDWATTKSMAQDRQPHGSLYKNSFFDLVGRCELGYLRAETLHPTLVSKETR
jgi:hypothetical protein